MPFWSASSPNRRSHEGSAMWGIRVTPPMDTFQTREERMRMPWILLASRWDCFADLPDFIARARITASGLGAYFGADHAPLGLWLPLSSACVGVVEPTHAAIQTFRASHDGLEVSCVHVPRDLRDLRHLAAVIDSDLRLDRRLQLGA